MKEHEKHVLLTVCGCVGVGLCLADEVASATGRRERLFVLAPSGSDPSGGGGSSTDGLTGMLSGLSLAGASQVSIWLGVLVCRHVSICKVQSRPAASKVKGATLGALVCGWQQ